MSQYLVAKGRTPYEGTGSLEIEGDVQALVVMLKVAPHRQAKLNFQGLGSLAVKGDVQLSFEGCSES